MPLEEKITGVQSWELIDVGCAAKQLDEVVPNIIIIADYGR